MDNKLKELKGKINNDGRNFTDEDMSSILEDYVKDDLDKEELTSFMKGANVTYQIFMNGIDRFFEESNYSSKKYTDGLQSLLDGLKEQINDVHITEEENERIWRNIDKVLDRMKEEAIRQNDLGKEYSFLGLGVAGLAIAGAITVVTKNPEMLKKGIEMIQTKTSKS